MVDAATEFKKSGFSEEDSATLAQLSSMFQNVADEEINAGDAANFLISQMAAFNIEAQNSEHIVDAINETANRFAVSSGQLSQGLSIAASSSSVMGNSLEETMGLMVAITEVTRNSSKAAKGISSIMSELANVLDPVSSNGEKIKTIFAELGISMMENGQLRTGYELLKDLANEWNNLDGNTQKYIATTIAGKTQINNFVALMGNFEHAVQATEVAYDSAGSAIRENAAYMDSLEAKTTALKATFQDLANNVIDNELVGTALSLLNGALQIVNNDVGATIIKFGLLTGAITGGVTIWGTLLQNLFGVHGVLGTLIPEGAKLATVFGALGAKALPVAMALSLAALAGYEIYKAWRKANPTIAEANEQLESISAQIETNRERLREINAIPWNERTAEILAEKDAIEKETDALIAQRTELKALRSEEAASILSNAYRTSTTYTTQRIGGRETLVPKTELIQGKELYMQIARELSNYQAKLSKNKKLTDEEQKAYNALVAEASRYATAMENVEGGVKSCTVEQQEMYNALKRTEGAYTAAVNYVSDYVNGLIEEAQKSDVAKDKLYDLVAAQIKADSQNLNFSQQIAALNLLAQQAGIAASAIAAVTGVSYSSEESYARHIGLVKTQGTIQGRKMTTAEAQQKILNDYWASLSKGIEDLNKVTGDGVTGSTDTKKATDKALERFKTLQAQIKHQLEMGEIDQRAYYNALEKLVAQYKEDAIAHMKEYGLTVEKIDENMHSFEEEIYKGRIELIEKVKEAAIKAAKETANATIDALNARKSKLDTAFNYIINKADDEIAALEKQKDAITETYDAQIEALEATNEALESQIEYEQLLEDLARAKSSRRYIFKGGQFQYVEDVDAVISAQKALDKYNRENQLRQEIKNLEKLRDKEIAAINDQIAYWEKYKQEWSNVVDAYTDEQDRLIAEEVFGTSLEKANWEKRIGNLSSFVTEYKSLLQEIIVAQEKLNELEKMTLEGIEVSYKGLSSSGTEYQIESERGVDFVANAKPGDKIIGSDGSVWVKNKDGTVSISKNGVVYKVNPSDAIIKSTSGATSSSSGGGSYKGTALSSNKGAGTGTYEIGSEKGKNFVSSAKPGSTMTGGDGSTWVKNNDGTTTISKGGNTWTVGGYANGTLSARGGLSLVGENGPELRVLNNNDGIIPADITRNLWDWGKFNPKSMMSTMSNVFNIDNLTLPNARDAETLISGLRQMAYQRAYKRV